MNAQTLSVLADAAESRAAELAEGSRSDRHLAQEQRIAAQDAQREIEAANGYPNAASLAAAIALDNDRAMVEARRRLVLRTMAKALNEIEDESPEDALTIATSYAADALRDWLRDEVIDAVTSGARHRIKRDMREARQPDANPHYAEPAERELAEGMELFVHAMAMHAASQLDWLHMAREVLYPGMDESYENHVRVLAALLDAYPNPNEVIGECPAQMVHNRLPEGIVKDESETVALLQELERLDLIGGRFVGGTSGTLYSPRED